MKKVCCQLSPFSHAQVRGDQKNEPSSDLSQERKSSRDLENERTRILFERQTEQILAEVRSEIQKHELQAESGKRSIQESTGIIDSQRMEIDHTFTGCEQSRRDQLLLQEELSEQNRDLRETRIKSLHEMEELKRVQELRVDEFSRRRLIENQDTINEFTARIQDYARVWPHAHFRTPNPIQKTTDIGAGYAKGRQNHQPTSARISGSINVRFHQLTKVSHRALIPI